MVTSIGHGSRGGTPVCVAGTAGAALALGWSANGNPRGQPTKSPKPEEGNRDQRTASARRSPRGSALEEVGAVPERAAVGHRARGLQRQTATPGTTSPTTRPARAPTAGARTASPASRDDQQRLCFALALWNGKRPDPQGAAVRAHQQRGQPRRGREGVLLLPRQHADALLHEVPVQVPAGGVSRTATWSRRTAGAAATRWSTSCSTPACSTTTATSTCSSSTPRPTPEDILIRITAVNRGPERGRPARAADAVVPQHLVTWIADDRAAATAPQRLRRRRARRVSRSVASPSSATTSVLRRRRRRCCSPRTRPTTSGCSGTPNATPLRQGRASTTTSCTAGATP